VNNRTRTGEPQRDAGGAAPRHPERLAQSDD
jgi:hypothetical protein